MRSDNNVLDLSSLVPERKCVRFKKDGPEYEMVLPSELSLEQRSVLFAIQRKMTKLNRKGMDRGDLSKEELRQLTILNDKAARLILVDVPEEEFNELNDFLKEAVVLDFLISFGRAIRQTAKMVGGEDLEKEVTTLSAN
jgi:hypothetical protein